MISKIQSEALRVEVDSAGAELSSLRTGDDHEYLWQGNPDSWGRRSPILFPIIGGLVDGRFTVDGTEYRLGSHGFARDRVFDLIEKSDRSLLYSITEDEETLSIYPYRFELRLGYHLSGNRLAVTYTVLNRDNRSLLFSIGGHPGFNVPLEPDLQFKDYHLRFDQAETISRHLKADGLLTGQTEPLLQGEDTLPLHHDLFDRGAVILQDLRSDAVRLESPGRARSVIVDFEGFPYLGIWSHPTRPPFVCIEPWFGVDSRRGDGPDLSAKDGIVALPVDQIFNATYGITLT